MSDAAKSKAATLVAEGKFGEAIEILKEVLKTDKNDLAACLKLAEAYVRNRQPQHAVRFYDVAAKRYAARGDFAKAIAVSKVLLKLDPTKKDVEARLADWYAAEKGAPVEAAPAEAESEVEVIVLDEAPETDDEITLLEVLAEDDVVEASIDGPAGEQYLASLPKVPIFSDLDAKAFRRLIGMMEVRLYEQGEAVIVEGEPGDAFYIITSGQARVVKQAAGGGVVPLATLAENSFFGEFAYLSRTPRTATVLASGDLELLEISREHLDQLVKEFPSVRTSLEKFFRERALQTVMTVSPLFRKLNPDQGAFVAQRLQYREARPGQVVVRENAPGEAFYVIAFGQVEVILRNSFGGEEKLADLGFGNFFGEMSLLNHTPTSARVTATQPSAFFVLEPKAFDEVVTRMSPVRTLLETTASQRQQKNQTLLSYLEALGEEGIV